MSNPAPQKPKRAYRHPVKLSECKKEIVAEYQDAHAKTKHMGDKVSFTFSRAPNQSLSELELRFSGNDQEMLCALGNICNNETPDKESFSHIAKFYNIDGEILEAEQKMYASFVACAG